MKPYKCPITGTGFVPDKEPNRSWQRLAVGEGFFVSAEADLGQWQSNCSKRGGDSKCFRARRVEDGRIYIRRIK